MALPPLISEVPRKEQQRATSTEPVGIREVEDDKEVEKPKIKHPKREKSREKKGKQI